MIDTIVLGLGAMGSSAAYHLAQHGNRVIGLEQFTPAHEQGSSHGSSRIIRQAYFENRFYVPLLRRSYELWERLEQDAGSNLLHITGGLMIGDPSSSVVRGSIESARMYQLRHEIFDAAEISRRFPPFTLSTGEIGLYEYKAGYLLPEACIRQHLKQASQLGADLHFEEPVESWSANDSGGRVQVKTARGAYEAERLVICCGAWTSQMLSALGLPLVVTRQVMCWFDPVGGIDPFLADRFPIYLWQPGGSRPFYGFPSIDGETGGVKVAIHGSDTVCAPGTMDRAMNELDLRAIRTLLAPRLPQLNGTLLAAKTCMYTTTPDENFLIDFHPQYPHVTIASGFSGHGFKFSSVVGEILADLALQGRTSHDIERFSMRRFQPEPHTPQVPGQSIGQPGNLPIIPDPLCASRAGETSD